MESKRDHERTRGMEKKGEQEKWREAEDSKLWRRGKLGFGEVRMICFGSSKSDKQAEKKQIQIVIKK